MEWKGESWKLNHLENWEFKCSLWFASCSRRESWFFMSQIRADSRWRDSLSSPQHSLFILTSPSTTPADSFPHCRRHSTHHTYPIFSYKSERVRYPDSIGITSIFATTWAVCVHRPSGHLVDFSTPWRSKSIFLRRFHGGIGIDLVLISLLVAISNAHFTCLRTPPITKSTKQAHWALVHWFYILDRSVRQALHPILLHRPPSSLLLGCCYHH